MRFVRSNINVKVINFPSYKSFELLSLFVRIGAASFVLVVVYRPEPESAVTDKFFVDWADVLERTSSFAGCFITGDINLYVEDTSNVNTARFRSLIDSFGLGDCVGQPTRGVRQLDIFVSRTDYLVPVVRVDPPMLSDHSLLVASFQLADRRAAEKMVVNRRSWRSFNFDAFAADLERSELVIDPPTDVADLFSNYDATLARLLDKHAPLQRVRIRAHSTAPWFDAECRAVKIRTRRLEKTYRRVPSIDTRTEWMVNFARQRTIYQQKFVGHWSAAIGSCQNDSKALWSKLRPLLQTSSCPPSQLTADDFARFFSAKIEWIRATTDDAPAPTIVDLVVPVPLAIFQPTTAVEISAILNRSAAKQCQLDPAPSWLIKRAGSILAPVIANICNASFRQKMMPTSCKHAIVRPLLKKPTLDPDDLNSYRPISNLSFLSKIVEKVVDARLSGHASSNNLLPAFQSAYRPYHSTETAMTCVFDGMIKVLDQGHVGALMLLDLSAAFDTVDPPILRDVLERRFGVQGDALEWLVNFLNGRTQVIRVDDRESAAMPLICGVPQSPGPDLGPEAVHRICRGRHSSPPEPWPPLSRLR